MLKVFSKTQWSVILISILYVSIDYSLRFSFELNNEDKTYKEEPKKIITSAILSKSNVSDILSKLEIFIPKKLENKAGSLSEEQQALQNGNLKQVFSGEKQLQLKAVIQQINHPENVLMYALIEVVDTNTGKIETIRFVENDNVYGFHLKILNSSKVQLSKVNKDSKQLITLVMYEKSNSTESNPLK